jgi:small subunit ribosomal protein S6
LAGGFAGGVGAGCAGGGASRLTGRLGEWPPASTTTASGIAAASAPRRATLPHLIRRASIASLSAGATAIRPSAADHRLSSAVAMSRFYDLFVLLDPEAPEERRAAIVEQVKRQIDSGDATLKGDADWGMRRLSYEIDHRREAQYHLFPFSASREVLAQLDRALSIDDGVLRHRIIRLPAEPETTPSAPEEAPRRTADDRGGPRRDRDFAGDAEADEAEAPEEAAPAEAEAAAEASTEVSTEVSTEAGTAESPAESTAEAAPAPEPDSAS